MLWRSHRSRCSQANVQGDKGTDPNPEARAARATPPSPGPRSPPARVRRRQTLSFPSPAAARWVPGSPVRVSGGFPPSLTGFWAGGRAGAEGSRCQAGVRGRRNPWPAGAERAIQGKVCQAGLGEQRAGGWPRPVCGLVCDSIRLHGVSKADLHALPGETSPRGGGEAGRLPRRISASSTGLELQARAAGSTGAPGHGPLASNFPARSQIYDPTPAPAAPGDARPERRAVNGSRRARRRRPGGLRGGRVAVP